MKASQMLTFFHPWVKMSSISFYSSFVTSLLSGRFCLLPLLLSLKRAAVAEPVIISALFSCHQRQPGPPSHSRPSGLGDMGISLDHLYPKMP
uniref:Uncharacterized protein n=1 Tax=Microcebus murinus TaxID=30608 RepID=A0A8C5YFE4_MICMU